MIKLGVLEFGYTNVPYIHAHEVINHVLKLAPEIERLGYERIWLSEHHTSLSSWGSPELMIAHLAGYTDTIRIGAAGILAVYNAPLRVAQHFKFLSAIYPGRIDLGLAKAILAKALKEPLNLPDIDSYNDHYNKNCEYIYHFLHQDYEEGHVLKDINIPPYGTALPDLWYLGSSDSVFPLSIKHKGNICISLFHETGGKKPQQQLLTHYRERFFEQHHAEPACAVAIKCVCLESQREVLHWRSEHHFPVNYPGHVIGTPAECAEKIYELGHMYNSQEIIITPFSLSSKNGLAIQTATIHLLGEAVLQKKMVIS